MIVGILGLQGAVREHATSLERLDVQVRIVKQLQDLESIDGLVLPGGESTAIGLLAGDRFLSELRAMAARGVPMFGTCAGMILLSRERPDLDEPRIGAIDISVERNASGRQADSFETVLAVDEIGSDVPAVFIRAPYITEMGPSVQAMSRFDEYVVMARQENVLVSSFHPELTDDLRVHKYFIEMVGHRE